jgi:uncharacterized membrane protein
MTFLRLLIAWAGCCAALLWSTASASAALKLCNQTSYILYAATGAATKAQLSTRGWTRVVPGDCATPISDPLIAPAYFVYARTSKAHSGPTRAWGGGVPICVRDTNFTLQTKLPVRNCPSAEFYKLPFALIDRHNLTSWTTTLTESTALKTLKDAKHAGVNRLLGDLGYHVNVPGERARDLALEDFHKRARLSADANSAALFAALEIAAMKASAPAGYSVCNQAEAPLWLAIGLPQNGGITTRGWWEVGPGACSQLISEPLHIDRVYLLVQKKSKQVLVRGPTKLCIKDTEFELSSKQPCKGKGFGQAGFALTDTKGRSGYVARIGDDGLVPVAAPGPPATAR